MQEGSSPSGHPNKTIELIWACFGNGYGGGLKTIGGDMGILMFRVDKDKIQCALKEMNQPHSHMKNEVKNVVEKSMYYEVFVDTSNDYPFMTSRWERNEFWNRDGECVEGYCRLSQAHLDAIPALLQPLIKCKGTGKPITGSDACKILDAWDRAREII